MASESLKLSALYDHYLQICVSVYFTYTSEKGKVLGESQTRRVCFSINLRQVLCLLPSRFLLAWNISMFVTSWILRLLLGVPSLGKAPWTILGMDWLWMREGVASAVRQRSFRDTTQGPAGGDYEETWRERSVNWREVGRPGSFLKSQYLYGGKNDFLKARTGTDFSTVLESRMLRFNFSAKIIMWLLDEILISSQRRGVFIICPPAAYWAPPTQQWAIQFLCPQDVLCIPSVILLQDPSTVKVWLQAALRDRKSSVLSTGLKT